jgi:hypothetical protein
MAAAFDGIERRYVARIASVPDTTRPCRLEIEGALARKVLEELAARKSWPDRAQPRPIGSGRSHATRGEMDKGSTRIERWPMSRPPIPRDHVS